MGRKSGGQDKGEGALDEIKGRAKEAAGAATGDKATESEGRSDQTKGAAKEKKGKIKDLLE
ncbi:MAG: CsbD family protein [Actinomycetota bacterium]|nr:CsbD family protein [Actinomycetota bacterium]